jgi:hypothetical protein
MVEYWRFAVVAVAGLAVFVFRRRAPRWVLAAYALLVAAVVLAWAVDWSWRGTLVVYAGLTLIASAYWLRNEERASAPHR